MANAQLWWWAADLVAGLQTDIRCCGVLENQRKLNDLWNLRSGVGSKLVNLLFSNV